MNLSFILIIITSILGGQNNINHVTDSDSLNVHTFNFPNDFLWGTATAAHQVEGNCVNNNWFNWETSPSSHDYSFLHSKQPAGIACDHWKRYPEDIRLMKELGVNAYRFSVEWSKIEPEQGEFNQNALTHYSMVIDSLIAQGITPMITLHHFTNPIWFEKLGAFERQENIEYFVKFSQKVFEKFSDRVIYWCTINEPAVYTVQGYFTGIFPPEKQNIRLATIVLKNLIRAHVGVYFALKESQNGENCQIGFVKNINQFKPLREWHPADQLTAWFANHFYNDAILYCLMTDEYRLIIPILSGENEIIHNASQSYDFVGLNYYSHNFLKFQLFSTPHVNVAFPEKEIKTDMPYTMYAQGFYDAIESVSRLKKPVIITENGVADREDKIRSEWITDYLNQLVIALENGIDIRGYFYWSLLDNYEWAEGYNMKFGLYEVDFKNQQRTLREGSKTFQKIIKSEISP